MAAIMVFAIPLASADSHPTVKVDKGPNASAVTWEYVPMTYGTWTGHIVNSGLKWLVVGVFDNTTGMPEEIMHQRIRFKASDAFPTGTVNTTRVIMSPCHKYLVTVTPNGPGGCSAVVTDISEPIMPPVASFTWTTDYLVVNVDGTGSYDPDGTVVSWTWDWGDGPTGCGVSTSHTYETVGTYSIMLLVTDESGLSDTTSEQASVVAAPAQESVSVCREPDVK